MKNVYKFGLCLLSALALNVSAQDFRGKDLNTSFRDKKISDYQFQKSRAVKGVTDFQRFPEFRRSKPSRSFLPQRSDQQGELRKGKPQGCND